MAKLTLDEEFRFSIIVNGNKAQKELLKLEKSTRALNRTNKELRAEKAKLFSQGKRNTEEYKRLTAEIKQNSATITANKNRMAALQKKIGITGLTMGQLRKRAAHLRIQLNNVIPNGAAYHRYNAELKKVNLRMAELRTGAAKTKLSVSGLSKGFNKYAIMGASVLAGATSIVFGIQKLIDYNGKLSDSQADVMKTTGMTKDEVDDLAKSFGLLKTRTSRINLLKIAEEGGRIGVVKEEIQDFVQVMNKANVALGDTFEGGVEEVASKLGKLKFLFKETKDLGVDKAYNAIGSAINELGANGIATESDIAKFATRVGALPDALKPTIADALGLGTAFSESGLMVEKAGRAYEIFMSTAATNTDKFARQMGMTTQQVKELINTNPTEFFLKFSESLADVNQDGVAMSEILKDLGLNATSVKGIIGAASNNTERFRDMIALSNKAMLQGTSLIKEYNIKNTNLMATVAKIKKKIASWFSSNTLANWLNTGAKAVAKFIGALDNEESTLEKIVKTVEAFIKPIKVLIAAIVGYYVAVKSWIAIQKAYIFIMNASRAAVVGYKVAVALLSGNIRKATAYMRLFNIAIKGSPVGIFAAVLSTAVAAYVVFSKKTTEATRKQKLFNEINKKVTDSVAKQKIELEKLLKIAENKRLSDKDRLQAIKAINKISPEYLGNIDLEAVKTNEARKSIEKYIEVLKLKALEEAVSQKRIELAKKEIDIENERWLLRKDGLLTDSKRMELYKKDISLSREKQALEAVSLNIEKAQKDARDQKIKDLTQWYIKQQKLAKGNNAKLIELQKEFQKKFNILTNASVEETENTVNSVFPDKQTKAEEKVLRKRAKYLREVVDKITDDLPKSFEHPGAHPIADLLIPEEEILDLQTRVDDVKDIMKRYLWTDDLASVDFEEVDILGFTPTQWDELFDNLKNGIIGLETMQMAVSALSDLWQKYNAYIDAGENRQLAQFEQNADKRKDILQRQLDHGKITQEQYAKRVEKIDKQVDRKKAEIEYNQAKRKQDMAVVDVIINSGVAILKAWAQLGPIGGVIAGAIIGGLAALQISTIKKQPLPARGYEDGFYPVQREQDGKIFHARYGGTTTSGIVTQPTYFLTGEKGPEMIIDSDAYRQMDPSIRESMHREVARIKGFESGYYSNSTKKPEYTENSTQSDDMLISLILTNIELNNKLLNAINSGIIATVSNKDLRSMKNLKEGIEDYDTLRTKSRI